MNNMKRSKKQSELQAHLFHDTFGSIWSHVDSVNAQFVCLDVIDRRFHAD